MSNEICKSTLEDGSLEYCIRRVHSGICLEELKKYKIGTNEIQETKWMGSGIMDARSHTILYSGNKNGVRELGAQKS